MSNRMMHSVHNHIDMAKVVKKYKIEKENKDRRDKKWAYIADFAVPK